MQNYDIFHPIFLKISGTLPRENAYICMALTITHNNNENGKHKGMMWMIIPCLLLLGFLFLGGDKLSWGGYLLPILIGVFVIAHGWMMFKGHGSKNDDKDNKNK